MKKLLLWLGAGWLLVTVVGLVVYWPLIDQFIRFNPMVSEADFPEPENRKQAQEQDLQYLATILDYDRSFSDEARSRFRTEIGALIAGQAVLSDAQLLMQTHALMALADNAHTGSDHVAAFRRFNRAGIDVYPFADRMFIVRAHQSHRDLLGRQLLSIDGVETSELLGRLAKYSGGPKQRRDLMSLYFLRSPALLHAAGIAENPDRISVEVRSADGEIETRALSALPDVAETEFSYRHPFMTLLPIGLPEEEGQWVRALDGDKGAVPLTLADPYQVTFSKPLGRGLYVRSNWLMETPENPVKEQLLATLESPPEGGFEFLVVDLRWNPGGDLGNAIPFVRRAAEAVAPGGKAYVIVGPQTFSAAIVTAALFRQYLPERSMIIGEPMGDRPQFWAERGQSFVLPNSGYHIGYATGYHDWEKGCSDDIEYCFPPNQREAADIGKLQLDKVIQPSFAEFAAGEDPVLAWVMERHVFE